MKLYKKELNKLVKVIWKDAKSAISANLHDFVKSGFAIKRSVGWLKYFDKEKIVIASENTISDEDEFDLTMIPFDWVTEMEFVEEDEDEKK